jgi:hypothetical protein
MFCFSSLQRVPANLWPSLGRYVAYKTEKLYQIETSPLQKLDIITSINPL